MERPNKPTQLTPGKLTKRLLITWLFPFISPEKAFAVFTPIGVQRCAAKSISACKLIFFPEKEFPPATKTDKPANCSAVVMLKDVSVAMYQLVSAKSFQEVVGGICEKDASDSQ